MRPHPPSKEKAKQKVAKTKSIIETMRRRRPQSPPPMQPGKVGGESRADGNTRAWGSEDPGERGRMRTV